MIKKAYYILFYTLVLGFTNELKAQTDTNINRIDTSRGFTPANDLIKKAEPISNPAEVEKIMEEHSPRKAAIRSAILPGWGQAYNKKYWKIPIVYGALGTVAGIFNYNLQWYKRTRYAYKVLVNQEVQNYPRVHPELQPFIFRNDAGSLQSYRNEFRRNIDYSVLVFILAWGLNVVDATVDAHLKTFDVSPDLSFQTRFGYSELAGTNGMSLVFTLR